MYKTTAKKRIQWGVLEGFILAASLLPLLFPFYEPGKSAMVVMGVDILSILSPNIRLICAFCAGLCLFSCSRHLVAHPIYGKVTLIVSAFFSCLSALPKLARNPFMALAGLLIYTLLLFSMHELRARPNLKKPAVQAVIRQQRTIGVGTLLFSSLMFFVIRGKGLHLNEQIVLIGMYLIDLALRLTNAIFERQHRPRQYLLAVWSLLSTGILLYACHIGQLLTVMSLVVIVPHILFCVFFLFKKNSGNAWVEMIISNPKIVLPFSFLVLVLIGTLLLCLPISTTGGISPIDALFTATSAVSMTGLTLLDPGSAFSLTGRVIILLLSQLGALGIMTITPVIINLFGQRLSMKQTRALNYMIEANKNEDILKTLSLIVKFTFIIECTGAIILTILMMQEADFAMALEDGIFTTIAAFCNAGFSLHPENMAFYQHNHAILLVTSVIILFGGLSPVACMFIPAWLRRRPIPPFPKLVLNTTLCLVLAGFFLFLCFEWNGSCFINTIDGQTISLSFSEKLSNSWFQVISARTAGLNSLDINRLSSPSILLFIILMMIGGSPSSTAGGLKTTLCAVLFLTCTNTLKGKHSVIIRNRKVETDTLCRAVTILLVYLMLLFLITFLLMLTQALPVKQLFFEAVSALGTVGLSLGITSQLDAIGKCILILAMYAGRVGASSIIMLISCSAGQDNQTHYPEVTIPLS